MIMQLLLQGSQVIFNYSGVYGDDEPEQIFFDLALIIMFVNDSRRLIKYLLNEQNSLPEILWELGKWTIRLFKYRVFCSILTQGKLKRALGVVMRRPTFYLQTKTLDKNKPYLAANYA